MPISAVFLLFDTLLVKSHIVSIRRRKSWKTVHFVEPIVERISKRSTAA